MDSLRGRLLAAMLCSLALPGACGGAANGGGRIALAVSSNAPALEEAVSAFRTSLGEDNALVFLVPVEGKEPFKSWAGAPPQVAVAFGSRAHQALAASDSAAPLIVSMVLASAAEETSGPGQPVSTLSLSLSPVSILTRLKSAFPDKKKLAVMLGPDTRALRVELAALASRLGYVLEIVDCSGPRDVLAALGALRGRVDFVWCLPDSALFPSAAIPPILLASIRNQLPLIGFSEGFVRAGAAVGFYPDYADIGVQTAETVKRLLSKQEVSSVESPRKLRMSVNERVFHVLGIERPKLSNEVLVIR